MSRYLKIGLSRWSASLALASMLAISVFGLTSSPIFAAACAIAGTPLDASAGSVNCDMSVTALINAGVLTLNNDAAATITGGPFTLSGVPIAGGFNFTSIVKDHRGVTSGWKLSAASSGLTNGSTTIPLNLTTGGSSSCTNGACPAVTTSAVTPLTSTTTTFLQAGANDGTVIVDGDYTNVTDGTFSIPSNSPSGSYTGTVTITLADTF